MKFKLFITIFFLAMITTSYGQQASPWDKWTWLTGTWKGEGGGQPGQSTGVFSFTPDLGNKILVRKAHSEYPAQGNKPAFVHDDLLIVYMDISGNPSKAIYFDNEGHTINYSVSYTDNSIVMLSDKAPNMPAFRLSYISIDKQTVNTKFEMAQDGTTFITYVEGKSKKTN